MIKNANVNFKSKWKTILLNFEIVGDDIFVQVCVFDVVGVFLGVFSRH